MLPEPLCLLISAYATGELSPRRKRVAVRLLKLSAEARRLLKDLRVNSGRLRRLRRPVLPPNFADQVCALLPGQPIIVAPTIPSKAYRTRAHWVARLAVAAAVLFAVAIGYYTWNAQTGG